MSSDQTVMKIVPIVNARLLNGAKPFKAGNVNATYRAQVVTSDKLIRSVILKDLDKRQLALELVVAALGKLLGFPIPNAFLVISDKTLATSIGPTIATGERLMFASEDTQSPPLAQIFKSTDPAKIETLKKLASWPNICSLFSLDTWVANIDRHSGNLLIGSGGVWYIDHGHCFGGPRTPLGTLDSTHQYPQKITKEIAAVMDDKQKKLVVSHCSEFPKSSSGVDAKLLLNMSTVQAILGSVEFGYVITFLEKRRGFVPKLGASLVGKELLA